ncbi:hypothetical protein KUM_1237 [Taylorella asinigenitalis 14/45]|uniref:Uncharacterized protein n=1 Tax=Taylorella asinigenitalis 14/45 TaxID=1091495 RepID=I7J2D3_9BURK|nr:hypothetical protein [Taylorella asinigenitalis]CCG20018.1 hypothetical protein KUM_1237 [Taylorella asinigenitalis 14/45]
MKNFYARVSDNLDSTIGGNETRTVLSSRTSQIHGLESAEYHDSRKIQIIGNQVTDISSNEKISIGGNQVFDVKGNSQQKIQGNDTLEIIGKKSETIFGSVTENYSSEFINHTIGPAHIYQLSGYKTLINGDVTSIIANNCGFEIIGGDCNKFINGSMDLINVSGNGEISTTGTLKNKSNALLSSFALGGIDCSASSNINFEAGAVIKMFAPQIKQNDRKKSNDFGFKWELGVKKSVMKLVDQTAEYGVAAAVNGLKTEKSKYKVDINIACLKNSLADSKKFKFGNKLLRAVTMII